METEIIEVQKCKACPTGKRCSDYDDDCVFVKDHIRCYLGGTVLTDDKELILPRADGYCPFIHTPN